MRAHECQTGTWYVQEGTYAMSRWRKGQQQTLCKTYHPHNHVAVQQSDASSSDHWRRTYPRTSELEFDRSRKLMSVCCVHAGQSLIFAKGAPESLLQRCSLAVDESGAASIEMTSELREKWEELFAEWGGEALRCVALAYSAVPENRRELVPADEDDLVFLGVLGLQDPPRPEAFDAVQKCVSANIHVMMLTGAASQDIDGLDT
jgi:magnesium-transporting ATPase (P-type)